MHVHHTRGSGGAFYAAYPLERVDEHLVEYVADVARRADERTS